MNRRKAITRIFLAGIGGGLAFSGYKWYDWNKTPDIDYLEHHRELISALAETIIPATDTPGAREAGVSDFIVTMIRDCTDRISANKFIDGLKELQHYCQSHFQQPFEKCGGPNQQATLQHFEEKGKPFKGVIGKAQNRWLGKSFFTTLKAYTVEGYCTSEAGATKGLAYLYIPGSYHGCIPLQPGQKAWATK
jgi:Gluconate 2-dehydrogenase subunit 3